jgi:hypothetical protein
MISGSSSSGWPSRGEQSVKEGVGTGDDSGEIVAGIEGSPAAVASPTGLARAGGSAGIFAGGEATVGVEALKAAEPAAGPSVEAGATTACGAPAAWQPARIRKPPVKIFAR